jgi:very-short-patch-repair endonuclease
LSDDKPTAPAGPHDRARELRRSQTAAEARLWSRLRNGQLDGFKFRRQFAISDFIADFCCRQRKLVIEVDGGQHYEEREKDVWRERLLAARGYRVLRFWNDEVLKNTEGVLEKIREAL